MRRIEEMVTRKGDAVTGPRVAFIVKTGRRHAGGREIEEGKVGNGDGRQGGFEIGHMGVDHVRYICG